MKFLSILKGAAAATAVVTALAASGATADEDKVTIALVPGLSTDGIYFNMRRGAQAAADSVGADLIWWGASQRNVGLQAPVVDALMARQFDVNLIAPNETCSRPKTHGRRCAQYRAITRFS